MTRLTVVPDDQGSEHKLRISDWLDEGFVIGLCGTLDEWQQSYLHNIFVAYFNTAEGEERAEWFTDINQAFHDGLKTLIYRSIQKGSLDWFLNGKEADDDCSS